MVAFSLRYHQRSSNGFFCPTRIGDFNPTDIGVFSPTVIGYFNPTLTPVGAEYQRAADHQQQITEGIQSAEETHGGIGDAIDRGTDRITESQGTVQSVRESIEKSGEDLNQAGRILADCQRILSRVRERKQ